MTPPRTLALLLALAACGSPSHSPDAGPHPDARPDGPPDAAPPPVPRLRLPQNHAYLGSVHRPGSMRPVFVWDESVPGATYEIDYSTDPGFAAGVSVITTAVTADLTYTPPADLDASTSVPVGARYFWRVRACVPGACSSPSLPWNVSVGRSERDYNGDGYDDLAVLGFHQETVETARGAVYLYNGSGSGTLPAAPDATLLLDELPFGLAGGGAPYGLAPAGDVNADGFADLVVGMGDANSWVGAAYVYEGSAAGPVLAATLAAPAAPVTEAFGYAVASAGDVDGDGYADVLVGPDDNYAIVTDSAWLYRGGPGPFGASPAAMLTAGRTPQSGVAAGDLNGDGYSDVAVGCVDPGRVAIYFGGPALIGAAPDALLGTAANTYYGHGLAIADVNGDGYSDLFAGTIQQMDGHVEVYLGSSAFDATPDATLQPTQDQGYFGAMVAAVGDLNGDGYIDLAVGDGDAVGGGAANAYFGGPGAFDPHPDGNLKSLVMNAALGTSIAPLDLDQDGYSDLVISRPYVDAGAVDIYRGSATVAPFVDPPAVTRLGPGGYAQTIGFGISVGR